MTQKVAALGLVIGLAVSVIAGCGYMLVTNPDAELTNQLVGAILTAFGAGTVTIWKTISGE